MGNDPVVLKTLMKAAYQKITALEAQIDALSKAHHEPIAIVGLGCRFPGAENPAQFWRMLSEGRNGVGLPPQDRWQHTDDSTKTPGTPTHPIAGFLDRIDHFDPLFFRISPREAELMDPKQRLLLEVTWEALEDAAIAPSSLVNSATGVFIGQMAALQAADATSTDPTSQQSSRLYAMTGAMPGFAPGRLSYFLGAQGPSMTIDCSCSASLMSVHLAVTSLRRGECSLAIAGGVHLLSSPEEVMDATAWELLTADGRCKTFDAAADGYGLGEGCGIVILKPLRAAEQDGDRILAVIRGSAANHDGPSSGLTVPNGVAQQAVIRAALADATVAPQEVSYIEANGIGTPLGDTMEAEALGHVFQVRTQPLWLGATAPNVGHLDAAAGMPSLIKAVLAIHHGEIPPNVNFQNPNPLIAWEQLPLRVPTERTPWSAEPRIAGVSSFGLSGSNVHIVLAQAAVVAKGDLAIHPTAPAPMDPARPIHLLALSAKNAEALQALAARYTDLLTMHPAVDLASLCYTANVGRTHFPQRVALVVEQLAELPGALAAVTAGAWQPTITTGKALETRPQIAFLFSGLGGQAVDMGRQLYETQPTFRKAIMRCNELLRGALAVALVDVLYPREQEEAAAALLNQTIYAETALFAVEYALAKLWQSWGIDADVVVGHSVGEYVAACIAGVLRLEDALTLVATRAQLMQSASTGGATAAIFAKLAEVEALLASYADQVNVAGVNSPEEVLIAGESMAVDQVLAAAQAAGLDGRRLNVSHAAHSPLMAPILDEFTQLAATVTYQQPQVKFISSVDGQVQQQFDATYWRAHLREPVRFDRTIQALQATECTVMVEIGPQPVLLWLGRQNWTSAAKVRWLASLRSAQTDWQQMLQSVSELYVQGVSIDWRGFDADYQRHKVGLPTYPFQRQRFAPPKKRQAPQPPTISQQAPPALHLPGLPAAFAALHLRRLPTTSGEWWYHAKQGADGEWHLQILDGEGHCIAETVGAPQPLAKEWTGNRASPVNQNALRAVDATKRTALPSDHAHHTLPNGLQIAHLNRYESNYVYKEIFVDRCYLKHGITLHPGAVVIDIGANIGLFSLFIQQEAPGANLYIFEPSPPAFDALARNAQRYLPQARLFNCGIADATKEATFTFYKNSSVFSSFHADATSDQAAIRTVVENMVRNGQNGRIEPAEVESLVDELMVGRLESQTFTCQLRALSDIIREEGITQIDLLKVDAEKSELAVLRGIRPEDWPKIQQIVIEIHEQEGPVLDEVAALLRGRGFTLAVVEERFLQNSGLYNIFATRTTERTNEPLQADTLLARLTAVTPAEQKTLLVNYLQNLVARTARIETSLIAADTTLLALGIDSLLAVEMRNEIKQTLGVTLPVATVLENSITSLAATVLKQVTVAQPQPSSPTKSSAYKNGIQQAQTTFAPIKAPQPPAPQFQEIEGEL